MMSPEWLTAIGTLGTFVVIAASAVAALIQLRHMRATNQLSALNELFEVFESPAFQDARRFINHDFSKLLEDPESRKLALQRPVAKQFESARMVAAFFENVGTLVKRGIIDPDILCDLWSNIIIQTWWRLSSWIVSARAKSGIPGLWENFEYLTAIAETYVETHPSGSYPPNLRRPRTGEVWPEARPPK
ncbi:MAG TPA: DUF4760 domain-containing protein [Candidatus Rubrimentiphilum sp.]|nr:DUF4760 domain-containing protein [Candidatus Rubrimentiphilum sp.]